MIFPCQTAERLPVAIVVRLVSFPEDARGQGIFKVHCNFLIFPDMGNEILAEAF